MKVLYSQLKKYLPNLDKTPRQVADVYTEIGFMLDKLIEAPTQEERMNEEYDRELQHSNLYESGRSLVTGY